MKANGATVILISHRQTALNIVDKLVVMEQGVVKVAGNKDDVPKGRTQRMLVPNPVKASPPAVLPIIGNDRQCSLIGQ